MNTRPSLDSWVQAARIGCVALAVVVALGGCPAPGAPDETMFTPIEVGVNYSAESIPPGGTRFYRFDTGGAGLYGVLLANIAAGGNLAFALFDTPDVGAATPILEVDASAVNGNESDQADLEASRTWYVVVTELAAAGDDVTYWILVDFYD